VIAPGERGEIDIGDASVALHFQNDAGAPRVDFVEGALVFFNADNPQGSGMNPTIAMPEIGSVVVRMMVYTLGEGASAHRLVHYTV
jgi:hypothetical protein